MHRTPHIRTLKTPSNLLSDAAGFIFDMDDLLIEAKAIWHRSLLRLLDKHGVSASALDSIHYRGLSAADTASLIRRRLNIDVDLQLFQQDFVERLLSDVHEQAVIPHVGAVRCVRQASRTAPIAIASGSPLVVIRSVLSQLGLESIVDIVVSSDEVRAGKPDPAVFIEAARRLDVDPRQCVVFEDSLVGVQAAISAGMTCIAVPSELENEILQLTPLVFQTLNDLPWLECSRP